MKNWIVLIVVGLVSISFIGFGYYLVSMGSNNSVDDEIDDSAIETTTPIEVIVPTIEPTLTLIPTFTPIPTAIIPKRVPITNTPIATPTPDAKVDLNLEWIQLLSWQPDQEIRNGSNVTFTKYTNYPNSSTTQTFLRLKIRNNGSEAAENVLTEVYLNGEKIDSRGER